jgi:hypothetical protein
MLDGSDDFCCVGSYPQNQNPVSFLSSMLSTLNMGRVAAVSPVSRDDPRIKRLTNIRRLLSVCCFDVFASLTRFTL